MGEDGTIQGEIRIYRKSTDQRLYTALLAPTPIPHGATATVPALVEWSPPAPADQDYYCLLDCQATNDLGHCFNSFLGPFYFDIRPSPMGPAPAAHHATHESGGMDELSIQDLAGVPACRGLTSGVASLDSTTKVPALELGGDPGATPNAVFLAGDQTWKAGTSTPVNWSLVIAYAIALG